MKYANKISLVPLIALLLAGCSGPTAIQSSTETDDLYYASTDKTVYASNQSAKVSENTVSTDSDANADEVANPEYSGTAKNNSNNNNTSYSDYDYYSDDYTYASRIRRFNAPYRGMSYYDFAYTDPYWYGSSFYAYNPFYDPFSYSPGFYRPGFYTGMSLNLGWGNPFYSPFYGYNNFYSPYGGGLFSGYRNGFNNGFYNGFYNGYYANMGNYDRYPNFRARNYGRRTERSVVPTDRNNANGRIAPNNGSRVATSPGGRPARVISGGGLVAPNTGNAGRVSTPDADVTSGRTVRGARTSTVSPTDAGTVTNPNVGQPARVSTNPNNTDLGYRPSTRPVRRYEGNITNNQAAPTPPSFPEVQRQNNNRPQRVIESRPRTFETPRYEAPRRYEMPSQQRNDSWSQPSRSSSFPSNSGGSNGGSSGGGGRPRRN